MAVNCYTFYFLHAGIVIPLSAQMRFVKFMGTFALLNDGLASIFMNDNARQVRAQPDGDFLEEADVHLIIWPNISTVQIQKKAFEILW